jgi:hypothetical protein
MLHCLQSWNSFLQVFSSLTGFIFSLTGLIVSGLTLWVACLAYTKFIKNKLLEKQLDVVIELIEALREVDLVLKFYLNHTDNSIDRYQAEINQYESLGFTNGSKILDITKNIFELADLPDSSLFKNSDIFSDISLTAIEKEKIDSFMEFDSNPILPNSIAIILKKFRISDESFTVGLMKNPHRSLSFVGIGYGKEGELSDISGYCGDKDGVAFTSWQEFIQCCQSVSEAIKKWMKAHGITEINF